MSLHTWWMFVVMTFVVSATPGPNMLLVMTTSARSGLRAAVWTMAGCMTALVLMMGTSAAGLGALLHAFPSVFDALRLLGAAYLAYLGVRTWRSSTDAPAQDGHQAARVQPDADAGARPETSAQTGASVWAHYRQGFLVAGSNPKAILFAAAFFPQFIQPGLPELPQFAILLTTFTVIEVSWYIIYALSGHRLSRFLKRASVLKVFNRVTGGVFVGFAGLMAAIRH
jgi:threonine/homoserine/homoserine lactone efflux protein